MNGTYFKAYAIAACIHTPLQPAHLFSCLLADEMNQYFQRHKLHSTCVFSVEVQAQCWSVLFYPSYTTGSHKVKKQLICIVLLGFNCRTCRLWLHLRKAFNSHGSLTKPAGVLRICRRKVLFVLLLWVTHAETYPPNPQRARDWVLSSDCWTSPFW